MNAHTISARGAPLVLLLVLAACAAPATGQSPLASPSASLPPPSDSAVASPSAPPSASLEDVATFDVSVETAPDWPALLDDSLWVLAPDDEDPAVVRLDPESGAEEARISLPGGSCEGIEAGFGSIWACTPDGMARIDAATNTIVATVPFQVPQPYYGRPAVSKDAVWSLSGQIVPTDVVRIDPATNAVTATYPLGIAAQQLTYGLGSLWATVTAEGQLVRIDPANGEITTAATDLVDPYAVTTGAGHVWVALQGRGTDEDPASSVPDLLRFDPSTGASDFFDYGMRPQQTKSANTIHVTDEAAWIKGEDPFLMRLDPRTGEVRWVVTSDRGSGVVVTSGGALWMTLWRDDAVVRIDL